MANEREPLDEMLRKESVDVELIRSVAEAYFMITYDREESLRRLAGLGVMSETQRDLYLGEFEGAAKLADLVKLLRLVEIREKIEHEVNYFIGKKVSPDGAPDFDSAEMEMDFYITRGEWFFEKGLIYEPPQKKAPLLDWYTMHLKEIILSSVFNFDPNSGKFKYCGKATSDKIADNIDRMEHVTKEQMDAADHNAGIFVGAHPRLPELLAERYKNCMFPFMGFVQYEEDKNEGDYSHLSAKEREITKAIEEDVLRIIGKEKMPKSRIIWMVPSINLVKEVYNKSRALHIIEEVFGRIED
jgi:hypothetical protein